MGRSCERTACCFEPGSRPIGADSIEERLEANGWGLWAVEPPNGGFAGFVGLNPVSDSLPVAPEVEVGWRLAREHWGHGYATEGALAAIEFGFERLDLDEIISFTAATNGRSRAVMERIGMARDPDRDFEHAAVEVGRDSRAHVLYALSSPR